jgi:hypothetical protein
MKCVGASAGGIQLYEIGKLKEGTSAKDQWVNGKNVSKNFTLKFTEEGNLIYAEKEKNLIDFF